MGNICGCRSRRNRSFPTKSKPYRMSVDHSYLISDLDDTKSRESDTENQNVCKYHINNDGSVSFYPSPHLKPEDLGTRVLDKTRFINSQKLKDIKSKLKYSQLEALYDFDAQIIEDYTCNISSFVLGALRAFNLHYPFKISPNHIFLLILHAIAINVDKNAEQLRDKYVKHEGKMLLTVHRDSRVFVLREQCKTNDWNAVITEFVEQIDANTVTETTELMEANFSDSTTVDVIANKICVMDICKNYFDYKMICVPACGFPKITLSGSKSDWVSLKHKADALLSDKVNKRWGAQWKEALLPLLDRFIGAYDGNIDGLFWNSMIKYGVTERELESSGGGSVYFRKEWFSGWFNILFPYVCRSDGTFVNNMYCQRFSKGHDYVGKPEDPGTDGGDIKQYPIGLSSAPVEMFYIDAKTEEEYLYDMKFISGIIGYTQCAKTLEIEPVTGWLITYRD
eukprot:30466_1